MMVASRRRRIRRQIVERDDGTQVVQTKPPRADVLWYPRAKLTTVLVRRTHDYDLAWHLAQRRWTELGDGRPLVDHRIGWWQTFESTGRIPPHAAQDEQNRVVQWAIDTARDAGPGIEFRP